MYKILIRSLNLEFRSYAFRPTTNSIKDISPYLVKKKQKTNTNLIGIFNQKNK